MPKDIVMLRYQNTFTNISALGYPRKERLCKQQLKLLASKHNMWQFCHCTLGSIIVEGRILCHMLVLKTA